MLVRTLELLKVYQTNSACLQPTFHQVTFLFHSTSLFFKQPSKECLPTTCYVQRLVSTKALETWKTRGLWGAANLFGEIGSISVWRKTLAKIAQGNECPPGQSSPFALSRLLASSSGLWKFTEVPVIEGSAPWKELMCVVYSCLLILHSLWSSSLMPEVHLILPSSSESSSIQKVYSFSPTSRYPATIFPVWASVVHCFPSAVVITPPSLFIDHLD